MGFKCGIVGLPNVGKSTLFNALTSSKNAQAANFPFCTIDPNIGIVDVPDDRVNTLHKLSKSKKKINTNITFVDIAGLVKARKGDSNYIYSVLMGYEDAPAGFQLDDGVYYNKYMDGKKTRKKCKKKDVW